MTDHLARAKNYIAKGDEYYAKAADEIQAWLDGLASRTVAKAASELGRSESWVYRILAARARNCDDDSTQPDWKSGSNKRDEVTRTVLAKADEQTVEEIVAALPAKAVERIVKTGTDRLVQNARAARAEHETEPTVKELMGDDPFNPAEHWADTEILRVHSHTRALEKLIQRAGGLILGSLSREEAFEYLQEAERQVAEARAAVQEQLRDEVQV